MKPFVREKTKGFSLIELLIIIAIVTALLALILPAFGTFRTRQALTNSRDMVVSYLTEARSRTLAGVNNTNYSVRFEQNRIVLFTGSIYNATASTNEYATFDVPTTLGTTTLHDSPNTITFDRLTGATTNYGTISFLAGAQTTTISINASGTISQ